MRTHRMTILALLALSCGGGTTDDKGTPDTASTTDTSVDDSADDTSETGDSGYDCVVDDPEFDLSVVGTEHTAEGLQRFEICSEGHEWLRITSNSEEHDTAAPTLRLFDPSGNAVGPTLPVGGVTDVNESIQRRLFTYLTEPGRWVVEVDARYAYEVIRDPMPDAVEPDSMDAPGLSAADAPPAHAPDGLAVPYTGMVQTFQLIPVLLDDAGGDVDWVRIPKVDVSGPVEIWGPDPTNRTSDLRLDVRLFDPDGSEVAAVDDIEADTRISMWDGPAGDYLLEIRGHGDATGWQFLWVRTWEDHFFDLTTMETEPNDSQATAEVQAVEDKVSTYRSGHIDDATDEDWLQITGGTAGWQLRADCWDEDIGGTAAVDVEVVDASGVPLQAPVGADPGILEMVSDSAWVHVSGASGRFGATAAYGCILRMTAEFTSTSE